ncbi:MAG: hypothetical protein Q8P59_14660, partial [Dehalococcoidia bacterium]|nr:hypothetical protein [Dehalococcoidia bacterium]
PQILANLDHAEWKKHLNILRATEVGELKSLEARKEALTREISGMLVLMLKAEARKTLLDNLLDHLEKEHGKKKA